MLGTAASQPCRWLQAESGAALDEEQRGERRQLRHSSHLSLAELATLVEGLAEESSPDDWTCRPGGEPYTSIFRIILELAEAAAVSVPEGPRPYLLWTQDATAETFGFARRREERLRVHCDWLAACLRGLLPREVLGRVAAFTLPRFDVRVCLYEDEHNADWMWHQVTGEY